MRSRGRKPGEPRRRAEKRLERSAPADGDALDARRAVHELQVHRIELEQQNEELRIVRLETETLLRRYSELFDFAPIGYFHLAQDGRITEANLAGARLLGTTRAQLLGRTLVLHLVERDRSAFQDFLAAALARMDPEAPAEIGEFALICASAGGLELRFTGTVLEGHSPSVLIAAEDVTARRRAERRLAEEARRKDEFLAALSHELRNPLAPIRNSLTLLQRSQAGGDQDRRALAVIDRQMTHLTRIVEGLLDVTRLDRGKIGLRRERLDLNAVVPRTVEDYRPAFETAGIQLDCRLGAEPCWADVDPSRLAQVLGNLLGNALKFTNRGGRVAVQVAREGGQSIVRVQDTGVGVAPEVLDRLFEPFSQAPQPLDRIVGGLGLGLALVKGLVELHGGTVDAASAGLGHGTELVVRLPAAPPAAAQVDGRGEVSLGPPRRILVIDDNEDAAATLQELLELGGHEVRVALDGCAGLELAHAFSPQVVLCDIGLPRMDGYQVARALRDAADTRSTWLVALSGYAGREDLERARAAGFDRHVAKPPSLEQLGAVLEAAPVPRLGPEAEDQPWSP